MPEIQQSMYIGDNVIIRSKFKLKSKFQAEILALIAGLVKEGESDLHSYHITLEDLTNTPRDIKKALRDLLQGNIYIQTDAGFKWYPLFISCDINEKEIHASIHPALKQHYMNLRDGLTHDQLLECLMIPNSYGRMIYKLLCSLSDSGSYFLNVLQLKEILAIPKGSLKNSADLQRVVLKKAKENINNHSDLMFGFNLRRNGLTKRSEVIGVDLFFAKDGANFNKLSKDIEQTNPMTFIGEFLSEIENEKGENGETNEALTEEAIMEILMNNDEIMSKI